VTRANTIETASEYTPQLRYYHDSTIEFEWIPIVEGAFVMGSRRPRLTDTMITGEIIDDRANSNEFPHREILLDEFRIARYPVTRTQFAMFVRATGYQSTAEKLGSSIVWFSDGEREHKGACWRKPWELFNYPLYNKYHPVTHVSWDDAIAFCKWAKVRLPTEAESEKAAKGARDIKYPCGNEEPETSRCNFQSHSHFQHETTPVDQYPRGANYVNVWDMAGNAGEWTSSLLKEYPYHIDDGREDLKINGSRVIRGGSFIDFSDDLRCARRFSRDSSFRCSYVGFRVAAMMAT